MSKIRTAAVLAVLTLPLGLTVSACGNGDDDKASKAISDSLVKKQSGDSTILTLKRKDADCIGDGFVDKIGTKKLQKYGLLTKDLKTDRTVSNLKMSAGDAKGASGVLFSCTDVSKMVNNAVGSSAQAKSLPSSVKTCISKALTDDTLKPMFTKVFQGQSAAAQKELTAPLMKCASGSGG